MSTDTSTLTTLRTVDTSGEVFSINGHDITPKEYNGEPVVTFKDIDEVHERKVGTARKRFNENKEHFIEGTDYFKTKCSEVRPFFGQTPPNGFNPNGDIILLTEMGYLMIVKSLHDKLAWEVQRKLVNGYFKGRQLATAYTAEHAALVAERNENIYLKNKLDKIESLLESRLETQAKAIETIKEDVALLFEPSEPNMKVVSTWKKTIVYPLIRMISDLTNKDESLCYKMVYSVMALHYGFCESAELARFERQYGTQYLSTINVIAIHPLFQERFVKAANEIVDKLKSKLIVSDMVVENIDHGNGDTDVIEESEAPVIKFTIQDDVEEIILKVAEFVGDNTKKQLATRRKIYSMITTNRGWKQALTRNRCDTKKDLVTLNHSYRKKFVKACNEIVGAA